MLSGFTRYFANKRLQVVGNAEAFFLKSLPPGEQVKRYETFFSFRVPCVVFSRNLHPNKLFLKAAEQARVPIFRCPLVTMKFINLATLALEMMFALRGTEMGSMVDILGDDITKVTLVDGREVVGTSAEVTRDHMEVRGIGIINVAAMFGVKSIRHEKRVDLVITLKSWNEVSDVDRLGLEQEFVKILGTDIPHITIPVRPGRDLARLVEVAAFQTKLKSTGYNPAKELNDRLISRMAAAAKL